MFLFISLHALSKRMFTFYVVCMHSQAVPAVTKTIKFFPNRKASFSTFFVISVGKKIHNFVASHKEGAKKGSY
jgi:hypothetical protein